MGKKDSHDKEAAGFLSREEEKEIHFGKIKKNQTKADAE